MKYTKTSQHFRNIIKLPALAGFFMLLTAFSTNAASPYKHQNLQNRISVELVVSAKAYELDCHGYSQVLSLGNIIRFYQATKILPEEADSYFKGNAADDSHFDSLSGRNPSSSSHDIIRKVYDSHVSDILRSKIFCLFQNLSSSAFSFLPRNDLQPSDEFPCA
jgi:hypothetical protein